ncbi:MAG: helix-turn-helix transcriptional regulator [Bacteroidota bacterium]
MIYVAGIVITFFLSFILLTKKGKSIADRILFVWLCVILAQLILFSIIHSGKYLQFPYLLGLEIPLSFLHGPFLFFYAKALTGGNISFGRVSFHFIPYTISFLLILPFLLLELEEKTTVYQNDGQGYKMLSSLITCGVIISGITYTVLSIRTLKKYKSHIKNNFSYTEKIKLEWLFRLIIGLSCIWVLVFFADDEIIFTSVVLFVLFIGYYGIKQVGIFTNQPPLELSSVLETPKATELLIAPLENVKYEKSSLTDDHAHKIHNRLVHLMDEKKAYLIPELTLAMVAKELGVHPNSLSQVINTVEQKNFFDYINTLRIREFMKQAANPNNKKYTLLSLAYECGFNSKTSFNRNFRNLTGQSPSEFLKKAKARID